MTRIAFDMGGTRTRFARIEEGGVRDIVKVDTPRTVLQFTHALRAYAQKHGGTDQVVGAVAGMVEAGVVVDAPNLAHLNGVDLAREINSLLSVPVLLHNDAALEAIGEAHAGAGKDHHSVLYITVGTGVGGALVVDGVIPPYARSFEPGRQLIAPGETLESVIAGGALMRRFEKSPKDLERSVYESLSVPFAAGIHNILCVYSPDIVVLGGSLMNEENGYKINTIRGALEKMHTGKLPEIVAAALKDEAGLYGAMVVG